uniref:Uncharacterized protein n=1 Tax=Anguilla anguilla TaxID=7936 RepID=A0A0E9S0G0_ANGAN
MFNLRLPGSCYNVMLYAGVTQRTISIGGH